MGKEVSFEYYSNLMVSRIFAKGTNVVNKLRKQDKLVLDSIDVVITEKCSLRCKDCSNLMQYFEKPQHSDYKQVIKAFNKLYESVDYISQIRVLGGEPFINPEFYRYIEKLKQYNNYDVISVYTNATIIPSGNNLQCLKDKRVVVLISDYGIKPQKIEEFVSVLQKEGVYYKCTSYNKWQDCGKIANYNRSHEQMREIFGNCCVKNTPVIKNGKLFRCPYSGSIDSLNALPKEVLNSIDLLSEEISSKELHHQIDILMKLDYLNICNFCGGRSLDKMSIPAAVQVNKPLLYKKY